MITLHRQRNKRPLSRGALGPLIAAMLMSSPMVSPSTAQAQDGDGFYGRLDSDVHVSFFVGGGVSQSRHAPPDEAKTEWALAADSRVRVAGIAGLVIGATGGPRGATLFVGAELRPLYPSMTLKGLATGREHLDLFLQSLFVELGVALVPRGSVRTAFAWGAGMEIPLVVPRSFAQGLWLRLAVRHVARARRPGSPNSGSTAPEWIPHAGIAVTFGASRGRVASWEPPRHRP